MEEHDIFASHSVFPEVAAEVILGRGTRVPDLTRLFAVLAARQGTLPTAQAMRTGIAGSAQGPADRMVRLFGPHASHGPQGGSADISGAFNRGTAHYLSGSEDGEEGVYRGA